MNKIEVYRTHIEIHDYKLGDCMPLEKRYGVWDPLFFRLVPFGRYYNKATKTLYIPRGTPISWLESMFSCEAVIKSDTDPAENIGQVLLGSPPRNEVQVQAVQFLTSMGKYKNNQYHSMLSLNLNTGKGKTYCSIAAMSMLGLRTIIITSNNDWLAQWKVRILEYTDIKSNEIYYISGTPMLMALFNRDISKYKVILCTHATLHSYANNNGWEAVHDFFRYIKVGLKVFDEAHICFDNMFMIDCFTNTALTYYVTATPIKSDENENKIYRMYFEGCPSIDLFNPDEDPHTHYIALRYNSNPTPIQISQCKNKFGMDRNRYTSYLSEQPEMYMMLRIILDMFIYKGGKYLIYIGTNEAIKKIYDWIIINYPELRGLVGIYTTLTSSEKKRDELNKPIILSTTKSAGAAVDIEGLTHTVNLAEPFKSQVLARQTLGRTRDDNTYYFDLVDNAFYFTKRFYSEKKKVFQKYAMDCKEVNIRGPELRARNDKIIEKRSKLQQPMIFGEAIDPMEFDNPDV